MRSARPQCARAVIGGIGVLVLAFVLVFPVPPAQILVAFVA